MEGILTEDISYRIWQSCSHHGEETVCISIGSVDGTGDNWVTATGTLVGDATSDDLRNVLANIGMVTQPMVQCKTELTDGDPRRRFQVRLPSKQAQILPKSLKFGRAGQKTRVKFDEVGKATEAGKVPSSNTTPGENKSGTKRNGGREGRPGRQEGLADARTKSRAAFCCSVEPTVLVAKCHEKKQKDAQKETV